MCTKLSSIAPAYIALSSEGEVNVVTLGAALPRDLELQGGATPRITAELDFEHTSDSQRKWTKIPKSSKYQPLRLHKPQHQPPLEDHQCPDHVMSGMQAKSTATTDEASEVSADMQQNLQVKTAESIVGNLTLAQGNAGPMHANATGCTPPNMHFLGTPPSTVSGPVPAGPIVERPKRNLRGQRRRRTCLEIATHLNGLEEKNPACILFARQISKLGFDSAEILKAHFEKYGPVETVLLSNSHSKSCSAPFPVRVRPSGMGFVVMQQPDGLAEALAEGETHVVDGIEVKEQAFENCTGAVNDDEPGHVDDSLVDEMASVDSQDVDFSDLPALRLLRDHLSADVESE